MKRFGFLDWARGLAVILMIQCHTFNSFVREDARNTGAYMLSQFVGGMAAPLFLFLAGMTLAFQMAGLDRREQPARRWMISLRRGAFVLGVAYLFRLTNYISGLPKSDWRDLLKVDILNAMGLAMLVFAVSALFRGRDRIRFAAVMAMAIAAASPVVAHLDWSQTPWFVREYLAPEPGTGRFAFFPFASYVGFGLAAGAILKRAAEEDVERLVQWAVLAGLGLVVGGQYFSSIPFSIYASSEFWTDSPALIVIRVGVALWLLAAAYIWAERCAGPRWSWMQCLGRNSLMVYLTHVVLVYGSATKPFHSALDIPASALATLAVLAAMTALSAAWLKWKSRRRTLSLHRQDAEPAERTERISRSAYNAAAELCESSSIYVSAPEPRADR